MDLWSCTGFPAHQIPWNATEVPVQPAVADWSCSALLLSGIFVLCQRGQHTLEKRGADSFPSVVRCPGLLRTRSHHSFNNSLSAPATPELEWDSSAPSGERMQQSPASQMTNTTKKENSVLTHKTEAAVVHKLSSELRLQTQALCLEHSGLFYPFFLALMESETLIFVIFCVKISVKISLQGLFAQQECNMKHLKCAVFNSI